MKFRALLFIVLGLIFTGLNPLFAEADRFTSQEWFAIPNNHRIQFVRMAVDRLDDIKVPHEKSSQEYLNILNDLFTGKQDLSGASTFTLISSIIYKNEPASRERIDKLIKKDEIEIIKFN